MDIISTFIKKMISLNFEPAPIFSFLFLGGFEIIEMLKKIFLKRMHTRNQKSLFTFFPLFLRRLYFFILNISYGIYFKERNIIITFAAFQNTPKFEKITLQHNALLKVFLILIHNLSLFFFLLLSFFFLVLTNRFLNHRVFGYYIKTFIDRTFTKKKKKMKDGTIRNKRGIPT